MMVKEFLEKARIKTEYFFFIYTYGMGYAEAFTHVEVTARKPHAGNGRGEEDTCRRVGIK